MGANDPDDEDDGGDGEKPAPADLFPFDEMSTGETSSLLRRANALTGKPDAPLTAHEKARAAEQPLKPMTGAQLAFRPSAPPRSAGQSTGSFAALKPSQPAPSSGPRAPPGKPATGTNPAFKPLSSPPSTGSNPAFKPLNASSGTGSNPAFKPLGTTNTQPAFKPQGTTNTQPAFKPSTGSHPAVSRPSGSARPPPAEPEPPRPAEEPEEEAPVFDLERLQAQIRHLGITDSALGRAAAGTKVKPTKPTTTAAEDTFVKSKMKQAEAKVPDFSLDDDLG